MNPSERDGMEVSGAKAPTVRPPKKKRSFLRFLLLIISYLIVAYAVWMVAQQWKVDPAKQQERAEQEIKVTVEKVGKLMILPEFSAEVPQVATINDAAGLAKTQAFFAGVKDGDQVLIYLKSQKAIIYRASENKIVNVGPVIADNNGNANSGSSATAPKATQTTEKSAEKSASSSSTNNASSSSSR